MHRLEVGDHVRTRSRALWRFHECVCSLVQLSESRKGRRSLVLQLLTLCFLLLEYIQLRTDAHTHTRAYIAMRARTHNCILIFYLGFQLINVWVFLYISLWVHLCFSLHNTDANDAKLLKTHNTRVVWVMSVGITVFMRTFHWLV